MPRSTRDSIDVFVVHPPRLARPGVGLQVINRAADGADIVTMLWVVVNNADPLSILADITDKDTIVILDGE